MKSKKSYNVIISGSAKADIKENAQWYNQQQKELGKQLIQSIKTCIKFIQQQPESFQIRYKNSRAAILNKFPYLIIYTIDSENKTISIIAVFHSSRNPEIWKSKI